MKHQRPVDPKRVIAISYRMSTWGSGHYYGEVELLNIARGSLADARALIYKEVGKQMCPDGNWSATVDTNETLNETIGLSVVMLCVAKYTIAVTSLLISISPLVP